MDRWLILAPVCSAYLLSSLQYASCLSLHCERTCPLLSLPLHLMMSLFTSWATVLEMIKMAETRMLPVRQALLIAYMTGVLWLRRNPMSLVFTAISPFSLLFVLFVISGGQYIHFAVAGSLVMALVGYGLALGQDISFYKTEYKVQDVFVASSVSPLTYMMGLALSELLFGLPALAVLPPVFYSIDIMPAVLRPLAYAVPTTHASLMLQYIMGMPTAADWSLGFGFAIQIAYLVGFIMLAKTKAIWREN